MLDAPTSADTITESIVSTIKYADIFDFPLTRDEIHRYLIGEKLGRDNLQSHLDQCETTGLIQRTGLYYSLPNRAETIEIRTARKAPATTLLTHAQKYGRLIAQLPFVKMVALTGSVAAQNPTDDADIDYMIITETNRLWLTRLMILIIDKVAQRDGYTLCPNFMLTDRNLKLPVRNLYVARELMQMLPLSGYPIYEQFLDQNRWVSDFLPNATPMPPSPPLQSNGFKKISQFILGGSLGNRLEKWEQTRKIAKLSHLQADTETRFTPDMCKGHYHGHLTRVMEAYGD